MNSTFKMKCQFCGADVELDKEAGEETSAANSIYACDCGAQVVTGEHGFEDLYSDLEACYPPEQLEDLVPDNSDYADFHLRFDIIFKPYDNRCPAIWIKFNLAEEIN